MHAHDRRQLTFSEVISLWQSDHSFAEFYVYVLQQTPFDNFFFECPPITKSTAATRGYEHVAVRGHGFASASSEAFSEHLAGCAASAATFANLGRDAVLVAPCERTGSPRQAYGHIAAFLRGATLPQQVELWGTVGRAVSQALEARGHAPTWLNTEGSGVPWLHVRLDSTPKYYHHAPYRERP